MSFVDLSLHRADNLHIRACFVISERWSENKGEETGSDKTVQEIKNFCCSVFSFVFVIYGGPGGTDVTISLFALQTQII